MSMTLIYCCPLIAGVCAIFSFLQSHLFSNSLVHYILDHKIEVLMPLTYASIPLHNGLVKSKASVLRKGNEYPFLLYHLYAQPESALFDEASNLSVLIGHTTAFPKGISDR